MLALNLRMAQRTPYPIRFVSVFLCAASLALGCSKQEAKPEPEPKSKVQPSEREKPQAKPAEARPEALQAALGSAVGTFDIDPVHSSVVFAVQHLGAGYVYGIFNKVTGKYTIAEDPSKGSVEVEIDVSSVFTGDKKRDDHLRSPDFFNTEQFPKIKFKSRKINTIADKLEVNGELEMHGVTKPLTLRLEHTGAGTNPMNKQQLTGFRGTTKIKRSDFDMKNVLGPAGDEIELTIAIEGGKQ
jgi:polyisoprenoid-binding protein YceI